MTKQIRTASGLATKYGLQLGYIQCHPDPASRIYLTWDYDSFIILGYDKKNKAVRKVLKTQSVTEAREALKCML